MIPKYQIVDAFRAQDIKRWHICEMSRQQSIAEHSFAVCVLSMAVGLKFMMDQSMLINLYSYSITHDFPEMIFGDIPTPTKAVLGITDYVMAEKFWGHRDALVPVHKSDLIRDIVAFADKLEAAVFYCRFGQTAMHYKGRVHNHIIRELQSLVGVLDKRHFTAVFEQSTVEAFESVGIHWPNATSSLATHWPPFGAFSGKFPGVVHVDQD